MTGEQLFATAGTDVDIFGRFISSLLSGKSVGTASDAKAEFTSMLDAMLYDLLGGEGYETYKRALDNNLISYGDFFSNELIQSMADSLHIAEQSSDVIDAWNGMIQSIFGENAPIVVPNVGEQAAEAVKESIESAPTPDIQTDANVHTNVNEVIDYSTQEATGVGTESMFAQTEEDLAGLEQSALAAESTVNGISIEPLSFDPSAAIAAADNAALAFESMASRIKSAVASLMGINFSLGFFGGGLNSFMPFKQRASGGPVKSGDLVMANENGNFEMMGRMGNQPVVANNQQIVAGISSGVAAANSGLETRMGNIERMLAQVITGGITARAKPSSDWGAHGAKSATQYSRVTGY